MSASPADTVRPARPGDESAIASIQVDSWISALGSRLGPRRHSAFDVEAVEAGWRDAIAQPPSKGHQVLVALGDDGEVAGFVACAPPKDLIALEVDPGKRRQGHGSRLLAAAAEHMRSHGAETMRLWALERDPVRSEFLETAGFAQAGMRRELDGPGITIPEQLWHTDLTPES
ncbi:GNAT family N-acetyltransferase [Demequina sp. NBRC 110054]|uniref:GNAT family N-acetyltransferase n=1 Tax=Demequina sp. NBRC 110054 TaxID=1570343 RepID=UPI0009FBE04D|nr:GNAT family N-acetyltransferase [Demequina sp. NBRC 110054]